MLRVNEQGLAMELVRVGGACPCLAFPGLGVKVWCFLVESFLLQDKGVRSTSPAESATYFSICVQIRLASGQETISSRELKSVRCGDKCVSKLILQHILPLLVNETRPVITTKEEKKYFRYLYGRSAVPGWRSQFFFCFNTLCYTGPSSRGEFAKNVVGGAALALATLFTPALTRPAAAAAGSLEELTAEIMLAKVRQGRGNDSHEQGVPCEGVLRVSSRAHDQILDLFAAGHCTAIVFSGSLYFGRL